MAPFARYIPVRRRRALQLSAFFLTLLAIGSNASAFTFTTLDVPGATSTEAFGINGHRQIAGFYEDANGGHGFLRDPAGTFTTLDVPGATVTAAFGINGHGRIVGYYIDANSVSHGFLARP